MLRTKICFVLALFIFIKDNNQANGLESTVYVEKGTTALISISKIALNKSLAYAVECRKKDHLYPIYIKIGKYPPRVTKTFKGRIKFYFNNSTLSIREVTVDDEGLYSCIHLIIDGTVSEEETKEEPKRLWHQLVVTEFPAFMRTPPSMMIRQLGDQLKLSCSVIGRPMPRVTWQKDGWPLLPVNSNNNWRITDETLTIIELKRSDRGDYVCRGRNSIGIVEHKTTVFIEAPVIITSPPRNLTTKEGLEAYFTCRASGYPSNITYTWLLNDQKISHHMYKHFKVVDGSLIFKSVRKEDTNSKITCISSNGLNPSANASSYLTVQYAARVIAHQKIVYGGLNLPLTVRCKSEAEPPTSTITWKRGDQPIASYEKTNRVYVNEHGELQFRRVLLQDELFYSCTPYNIIGTHGESPKMELLVRPPPVMVQRPQEEVRVNAGQPFNASCSGKGDPTPKVFWEQEVLDSNKMKKVFIRRSVGRSLVVGRSMKIDNGRWRCVVNNQITSIIADMRVLVIGTTPHVPTNISVTTTTDTATISWVPGFDGGLPQHFLIWYRRSGGEDYEWLTLFSNGKKRLETLHDLRPESVYEFLILPTNSIGSGNFSRTVIAQTKAISVTSRQIPTHEYIAPPGGLNFSLTNQGLIQLKWNSTQTSTSILIGLIIEYKHTNTSGRFNFESKWESFAMVNSSKNTYIIAKERIFRDHVYKFRIFGVYHGFETYSLPSEPILVNTSGFAEYPFYFAPTNDESVAIISGIICGVLMMIIAVVCCFVCCYLNHRSNQDSRYKHKVNEADYKHILTFRKKTHIWNDSEEKLETLNSDSKTDFSNHNSEKIKDHKVGVFPRLKKKFSMNRSNDTVYKKNLLKATTSKTENLSEDCHPSKKISIIHRSADGKFRPSSKSSSIYQSNPLNSSAAEKTAILRRHSTLVTTKDAGFSSHRPISDCYGEIRAQTLLYAGLKSGTIQEEEELMEEEEYEIDCSRSDIEVRCLSRKNSPMINQNIRHSMKPMKDYESVKVDFPKAHYISLKELSNHQAPFRLNSRLYLDSLPPVHRWRHLENVYGTWSRRSQTQDRPSIDQQKTWTIRPHLSESPQQTHPQASSDVMEVNDVELEDSTLEPSVINSSNSMPSILPQPTNKCDVTSAPLRRSVSGDNLSEVTSLKDKTSNEQVEKLEESGEDQLALSSLPTSRQNQDLSDSKATRLLNDVTSSSSGYESRNASASSSSESSASQLRHVTLHCADVPSLLRPASLSLKCDGTRDRLEEVKRSATKLDALHLMHPESFSKRDTSSVDDKYEWDSENAIKSDILDALHNYRSHKNLTPQVKLNDISLDSNPALREDTDLIDERCSEKSEEDVSYSKESMEKRCAALKKEYRQYKYFQKFNVDTTNC